MAADVTKSGDVQNYIKATLDAYDAIDCFFNNAGALKAPYPDLLFRRSLVARRGSLDPD